MLIFFSYQMTRLRRLYDSLKSAEPSRSLAIGKVLGYPYHAVAALIVVYFERQRLRKALLSIDERLLDDIGLNRSDIEQAAFCRPAGFSETKDPVETTVAKPILVEAILRWAA